MDSQGPIAGQLPLYLRLRLELMQLLSNLSVGTRFLTEGEIVERFECSRVTVRKALDTLRSEGYLKSTAGRGTFVAKRGPSQKPARRASRLLGLAVPGFGETGQRQGHVGGIVAGIEAEAREQGYHIVLMRNDRDQKNQIEHLNNLAARDLDGLLIYPHAGATEDPRYIPTLQSIVGRGVPLVLLDRYAPQVPVPAVLTDNVQGMYLTTRALLKSGRTRLALMGYWKTNVNHQDRRQGFINALEEFGLKAKPVLEVHASPTEQPGFGKRVVARWLSRYGPRKLPFDGIACMNDGHAHGAFVALREAGLRVPEDVGLAGFDNLHDPTVRMLGLELTSVQQPSEQMGREGVRLLLRRIGNRKATSADAQRLLLPPTLFERTSSGAGVGRTK